MNAPLTRRALTGLIVATLLCLIVGGYALAAVATGFALLPPEVARDGISLALATHVASAGLALLTVPWQLIPVVRKRWPAVHRWLGRVYAAAAVVGGLSGIAAAIVPPLDAVTTAGFVVVGVLWTAYTVVAVVTARNRSFAAHRRAAIVSFALAFAAVTLRVELPVLLASGVPYPTAYLIVAWLCWVPNLAIALWFARRGGVVRARQGNKPARAEQPRRARVPG